MSYIGYQNMPSTSKEDVLGYLASPFGMTSQVQSTF